MKKRLFVFLVLGIFLFSFLFAGGVSATECAVAYPNGTQATIQVDGSCSDWLDSISQDSQETSNEDSECNYVKQEGRYYCTLYYGDRITPQNIFGSNLSDITFDSVTIESFVENSNPLEVKLKIKKGLEEVITPGLRKMIDGEDYVSDDNLDYNYKDELYFDVQNVFVDGNIKMVSFAIESSDTRKARDDYWANQPKDKSYFSKNSYCTEGKTVNEADCVLYQGETFYPYDYAKRHAPFQIRINAILDSDENPLKHVVFGVKIPSAESKHEEYSLEKGQNFSVDLFDNQVGLILVLNDIYEDSVLFNVSFVQDNLGGCIFGCYYGGECYSIGYQKAGMYCTGSSEGFVNQVKEGGFCERDYECGAYECDLDTNTCGDGTVLGNFWRSIVRIFQ